MPKKKTAAAQPAKAPKKPRGRQIFAISMIAILVGSTLPAVGSLLTSPSQPSAPAISIPANLTPGISKMNKLQSNLLMRQMLGSQAEQAPDAGSEKK